MSVRAALQNHLSDFHAHRLDQPAFLARITEVLGESLACSRVSIWRLSPGRDQLLCEDLYLTGPGEHHPERPMSRIRFPDYFWHLDESRALVAPEARIHPGTRCLAEDYLVPLDIHSLLDSPILRKGRVAGLVRCEQTGHPRSWLPSDLLTVRMATMLVGTAGLRVSAA